MSTRRLYYVLGAIALVALLTLGARAAFGARAPHAVPHSADLDIDSATRSYMAWAKAIAEQQNNQIDSATRSYMAWAEHIEEQQNSQMDSATRSYMAWAKYIEEQQKATTPAVAP